MVQEHQSKSSRLIFNSIDGERWYSDMGMSMTLEHFILSKKNLKIQNIAESNSWIHTHVRNPYLSSSNIGYLLYSLPLTLIILYSYFRLVLEEYGRLPVTYSTCFKIFLSTIIISVWIVEKNK